MFQYKFDKETVYMLLYSLALHKYRGYVGGFEALVKYFAGICFEKMMLLSGEKYQPDLIAYLTRRNPYRPSWHEPSAGDVIDFLEDTHLVSSTECNLLHEYWKWRCSVMHSKKRKPDWLVEAETPKLLEFLCAKVGWNFKDEVEKRTFEDISAFGEGQASVLKKNSRDWIIQILTISKDSMKSVEICSGRSTENCGKHI